MVSIHGMPVTVLSTDAAKEITGMMCISAAEALKRQCGQEYGFAGNDKLRATDISELTPEEIAGLQLIIASVKEISHSLIKKLLLHTAGMGSSMQRTSQITWCFINRNRQVKLIEFLEKFH